LAETREVYYGRLRRQSRENSGFELIFNQLPASHCHIN